MFFSNVGALRDPNIEFSHYETIRNLTEDGRQQRKHTCLPRDSVGGTALRPRGRFSALMRHPAGTIWRAHRDSTRAREDYNILAPSLLLSSRPSVSPTGVDSDSKAETNFADFSISGEDACHRATYANSFTSPLLSIWCISKEAMNNSSCFYDFFYRMQWF